ncbi:MAG: putative Ig domain-containing protein [Chloroflexota bacterium]
MVLAAIGNPTITEETNLTFTASATDSDIPTQILSYSLGSAPSGATINSGTGVFSWTPTEAQGPGVYTFTVIASDNGAPVLTDSQQVMVTVNELNQAPVLAAISNQTILETNTLSFTIAASDGDIPSNGLTYSFTNNPPSAALDSNSGLFSWTPSKTQGPGIYTVTFTVSDDGVPVLADSQTITITVADTPPNLRVIKTVQVNNHPVTPGEVVTYTLILSNSGGAAPNITLNDQLPLGLRGNSLNQVISLAAETNLTLTLVATATADAGFGVVITNTATFSHTSRSGSDTASFSIIPDTPPPDIVQSRS